ncbi:rhomboid family intramembrane serine protease [Candidatus Woesearchaeota archaeon]|nr:rhomboid family intramembrane serine protease [Candidatus Woesearchaeota archaeon]
MKKIESETIFIWKLIFHVLLTPIILVLVLFKKKEFKDLFQPFKDIVEFVFGPKFSITMIIVNILIFFVSIFMSEALLSSLISYPSDLLNLRLYTLITSGFLHANAVHLFGNMLGIFIFGRIVERKLGVGRTALVYFGALIISGVFSSLIHLFILGDNIGGLGASGALMGLVAAAILVEPFYIVHDLVVPMPVMVVGWLTIYGDIMGVLNPIEDGIGHLAHIGGFISIALTCYLLGIEERAKLKRGLIINLISLGVFLAYIFLFNV